MAGHFNANVERDVREAKFCRVVIYPPMRGWVGERVHLEVSNSLDTLGQTDVVTGAGYYLVWDGAEEAREAGICVSIGMWVLHDIGFVAWSVEIGVIVGTAMSKAAHQATAGRGRKG